MASNFPHNWKKGDVITAKKLNEIEQAVIETDEKINDSVNDWLITNPPQVKIKNSSINKVHLSEEVQNELNKINNIGTLTELQTENKDNLVNAINEVKDSITGDVLTPSIKEALLYITAHIVYENDADGQECYDRLYNALY